MKRPLLLNSIVLVAALTLGCGECDNDFNCPGTDICSDGSCERFVCKVSVDCPPGRTCKDNSCKVRTSPPAVPDSVPPVVLGTAGTMPPIGSSSGPPIGGSSSPPPISGAPGSSP